LERLRDELEALARAAPGRLGASVFDVTTGARASVRGDDAFPLAGTAKLAVALAAFRRADQHRLDLNALVLVTAADLRHGSAIALAHPRGNVYLSNWMLIEAMLANGDNTATDVLLGELGGPDALQTFLDKLGTHGFRYRKSEADAYADAHAGRTFARGADNAGTPSGVADLLAELVQVHYLSLGSTNEMLSMLLATQSGSEGLAAGLPPGASLAHEAGSGYPVDGVTGATNDAGILTLPDGRRIVIVAFLASARGDAAERNAVLARVARAAYDAFGP
jgi:beta-lactamase class A